MEKNENKSDNNILLSVLSTITVLIVFTQSIVEFSNTLIKDEDIKVEEKKVEIKINSKSVIIDSAAKVEVKTQGENSPAIITSGDVKIEYNNDKASLKKQVNARPK